MMRTKVASAALLLTTTIIGLAWLSLEAGSLDPAEVAQPQAGVTAIRAGRLIDTDAGTAATDQVILIAGGRITAVGRDVAIPAGANVIDLSKASVLPGLVDAHTHLCMEVNNERDNGSYYYTTLNDPDAFRAVQGTANAKSMLEAGFTAVRDVGNEGNFACVQVRKGIMQGLIPGPTMITAGRIIAPYGGQFHLQPDKRTLAEPEYFFADTRDEMLKAVRENLHYGATVIKIVVDDQRYIYSADDIRFIKAEAARAYVRRRQLQPDRLSAGQQAGPEPRAALQRGAGHQRKVPPLRPAGRPLARVREATAHAGQVAAEGAAKRISHGWGTDEHR